LQGLHYPSEIIEDNLNNIRYEASRHFGIRRKEYLKKKIISLQQAARTRTSKNCRVEKY
jgi:hypothetical protein